MNLSSPSAADKRFNPTCAAAAFGVKSTVTRAAHAG